MADLEAFRADLIDYLEGTLSPERKQAMDKMMAESSDCRAEYEEAKVAAEEALPLHKMSAPQDFGGRVTSTIAKRSGNRFFGPRSWMDGIGMRTLAIVVLVLVVATVMYLRLGTGPLHRSGADESLDGPAPEQVERIIRGIPTP